MRYLRQSTQFAYLLNAVVFYIIDRQNPSNLIEECGGKGETCDFLEQGLIFLYEREYLCNFDKPLYYRVSSSIVFSIEIHRTSEHYSALFCFSCDPMIDVSYPLLQLTVCLESIVISQYRLPLADLSNSLLP